MFVQFASPSLIRGVAYRGLNHIHNRHTRIKVDSYDLLCPSEATSITALKFSFILFHWTLSHFWWTQGFCILGFNRLTSCAASWRWLWSQRGVPPIETQPSCSPSEIPPKETYTCATFGSSMVIPFQSTQNVEDGGFKALPQMQNFNKPLVN